MLNVAPSIIQKPAHWMSCILNLHHKKVNCNGSGSERIPRSKQTSKMGNFAAIGNSLKPLNFVGKFCSLHAAQKMKFSVKDFFSKCDQIHSFLPIWSHLLKNSWWKTSFSVQLLAWHDPGYASAYHVTKFRHPPYFD